MAVEFHNQPKKMTEILEYLNLTFAIFFALEMFIKLMGLGFFGYLKDPFNLFDGIIVFIT